MTSIKKLEWFERFPKAMTDPNITVQEEATVIEILSLLHPDANTYFTPANWASEWRNFRALYFLLERGFPYHIKADIIGPKAIYPQYTNEFGKVLKHKNPQLYSRIQAELTEDK